jgi:hypothetical protein
LVSRTVKRRGDIEYAWSAGIAAAAVHARKTISTTKVLCTRVVAVVLTLPAMAQVSEAAGRTLQGLAAPDRRG